MTQHNCEDLKPSDTPSTVSSFIQVSSDIIFNPTCPHNPMVAQSYQSQYLTLLKQSCSHNPSADMSAKPTFPTL